MLEHAPKLPRVVREEDFHKASRMILDPNTIAVVTPYGETFRAACKSMRPLPFEDRLHLNLNASTEPKPGHPTKP